MRLIFLFILIAGTVFSYSMIFETYSRPAWPAIAISLLSSYYIGQNADLRKQAIPLSLGYSFLFCTAWLRSSAIPFRTEIASSFFIGSQLIGFSVGILFLLGAILATSTATRKHVTWAVIAICLGCLIAYFSGDKGGADPLFAWLHEQGITGRKAEYAVIIIRKSIHLGFYGFIAYSFYKASLNTGWAIVFAVTHAIFDEMRQALAASNRSGSVQDILIDVTGIVIALAVAGAFKKSGRRQVSAKPLVEDNR